MAHTANKNPDEASVVHLVEIRDFMFVAATLQVRAGDTVTWINKDIVPHTATALDGSWDSGMLNQGDTFTVIVSDTMTLNYFCEYHPVMKAGLRLN